VEQRRRISAGAWIHHGQLSLPTAAAHSARPGERSNAYLVRDGEGVFFSAPAEEVISGGGERGTRRGRVCQIPCPPWPPRRLLPPHSLSGPAAARRAHGCGGRADADDVWAGSADKAPYLPCIIRRGPPQPLLSSTTAMRWPRRSFRTELGREDERPVRLAYQPPAKLASSIFFSEQTSHQQPTSSTFLSERISTSHQPNEQAGRWPGCVQRSRCGAHTNSDEGGPRVRRIR
jgi:hypothetical protein